jgi:protease-4
MIRGIFIKGGFMPSGYGCGYSAIQELIDSLVSFKSCGKSIIGFCSTPTQLDYLVYSVCDELHMNPSGVFVLKGLASEQLFLAEAFDKYGVGLQVVRVGDFKGAVEPFTSTSFSEENRLQINRLLDLRWNDYMDTVSRNRGVEREKLSDQINEGFMFTPERCEESGLVDQVSDWGTVLDRLSKLGVLDDDTDEFSRVGLIDYVERPLNSKKSDPSLTEAGGDKIAIVYIEGAIIDGWGDDGTSVGGDEIASRIRKIWKDNDYKGLVVRVNSPGGSVSGSESILSELNRASVKGLPVVISMGSVAASGGYWIAMGADQIFAGEQTITGSIGVFGLIPNLKQLAKTFGLNWDVVKTHTSADVMSVSRAKSDEEISIVQNHVDRIYERFLSLVAENRDLNMSRISEVAQGRVWMGGDAHDIGLIDQLGTLTDAVAYTADRAGVTQFEIIDFPQAESPVDAISELFETASNSGLKTGISPINLVLQEFQMLAEQFDNYNDPTNSYSFLSWYRGSFGFSH